MKNIKLRPDTIGDPNKFPVINSIVGILEEMDCINLTRYCIKVINELHTIINNIQCVNKRNRIVLLKLIQKHYYGRLKESINNGSKLNTNLENHMKNLIFAIINNEVEKIKSKV